MDGVVNGSVLRRCGFGWMRHGASDFVSQKL
jgi:hypothetical protein